jgi:hypothetical protein
VSAKGGGPVAGLKGAAANAALGAAQKHPDGDPEPALVGTIPVRGEVDAPAPPIPTFVAVAVSALSRGLADGFSVTPGSDEPTVVLGPGRGDDGAR